MALRAGGRGSHTASGVSRADGWSLTCRGARHEARSRGLLEHAVTARSAEPRLHSGDSVGTSPLPRHRGLGALSQGDVPERARGSPQLINGAFLPCFVTFKLLVTSCGDAGRDRVVCKGLFSKKSCDFTARGGLFERGFETLE